MHSSPSTSGAASHASRGAHGDAAPAQADARDERRRRIAELVRERRIASQMELQRLLAREGIVVNQATLSRDVRAMGLLKGREGYELAPEAAAQESDASVALFQALYAWLLSCEPAGNLVVARTPAGGASPLGIALDHAQMKDLAGTIAGDDTLLLVCRSAAAARRVSRSLLALRERRKRPGERSER